MNDSRLPLVLITMTALGGCDDRGSRPAIMTDERPTASTATPSPAAPRETRPIEVDWNEQAGSRHGKIKGGGKIEASGYEENYHITLSDLPKGVSWKLGDKKGTTDSPVYTLIDLPILDRIGERTMKELEQFDPQATLELTIPDGRAGSIPLPPVNITYAITQLFEKVENAPLLFGQEPDDPKKSDSLIWPSGMIGKRFVGKSGKLHEIDWVLFSRTLPEEKGRKTCSGYQDNSGKPMPDLTLVLKATEATIYDRRTGEVVVSKVFPPDDKCPMFTFRSDGDNDSDSSTPFSAIEAWARSQLKR